MTQGIIVSPANRGVQVVVTDENNVQLLIDSNRGVNLEIVPQPRIEVLVDKGVEGAQGPVGPQGPQGPQGTAATVTAGTTTTGLAGTNAIVTNSGTSSAAVFDFTIPRGDTGLTGATGAGVAVGGTTGQVLVKASNVNYDTTWATITGTLVYQGSWNASTNTPTLTSSVGTNGYYYVVGTSGSTNLNGITDWVVGDWAIFNGTIWQKIDNTDLVSSVNGQTGVVVLTASSVGALAIANNLSDLADAPTARTNLGLGTAATQNSTAFATAAQGATADTALQTVTSADGSIVVLQTGTNIDLAVSAASPASTLLTQVRNTTGATLTKGTVVYISGATGQISTVSKAIASGDSTSAQTLGMITANLANNSNGYVTVFGLLQNMNTSAYTDGAQLYLSGTVAGEVTATKPSAPTHLVYVAVVEYAHPTQGKLLVKVQNGYELDEIHDVSIVSPTTGQTLVYSSVTDLWSNSNAPTITGGTINNTTVGATTPSTGVFTTLTATGQTSLGGVAGSESLRVLQPVAAAGLRLQAGVPSSTVVRLGPAGSAVADFRILAPTFTNFYTGSSSDGLNDGAAQMRVSHTASAVNYVQVTGAATGGRTIISMQGSDTNIPAGFYTKGSGGIDFRSYGGSNNQFVINGSAVAVNYLQVAGSATGASPVLSSQGSDTNIAQVFQSKGTGAIDLAAGSSGVNISNGGTVTAITTTANGNSYTSLPSIAISAPTTAGGVQATSSVSAMFTSTATIVNGGTGYTVNDVITLVGGTVSGGGVVGRYTVTAVSGGVITAVNRTQGNYVVLPTNPVSVTGGTGTNATFNVIYTFQSASITNAGSGYVEQPTVTFSGGGGSGAAAYATVGSPTVLKTIGNYMAMFTPGGEAFRVADSGRSTVNFWTAVGSSTGVSVGMQAVGSDANVSGAFTSKGTGAIAFATNTFGAEQLRVAHTASAVNYVQVTGAATGGTPTISAQGSDANIGPVIASKGVASVIFMTNSQRQFDVYGPASAVNYIRASGAVASSSPTLASQGSDTNIDLNLTTKGTGKFYISDSQGGGSLASPVKIVLPAQYSTTAGTVNKIDLYGLNGNYGIGLNVIGSTASVDYVSAGTATTRHAFFTGNGVSTLQSVVSHTASAVNYVQVTGGATGVPPVISAQGSDTNAHLTLLSKGSNGIRFSTAGASNIQAFVSHTASAVNYLQLTGAAAGSSPVFSVAGTDTNIDLTLTPKGTGNVRFGTYTGTALSIAGFIEIKDSGGTVRKLAVVA